jgi:hypothetical protein
VFILIIVSTDKVLFTMIGDEDHRVRSAVANCLTCLMESWTVGRSPSNITRAKWLASVSGSTPQKLHVKTFAGVPLSINGLAEAYWDVSLNQNVSVNLAYFVDEIFQLLVSSNSKFVKVLQLFTNNVQNLKIKLLLFDFRWAACKVCLP